MIIWTAKVTRKSLAIALTAAAAVLCVIIVLVGFNTNSSEAARTLGMQTRGISDNDARVAFLTGFGWDVGSEPVLSQEVLIPKEWDEVFTAYNDLQVSQGFDLKKYKGKRVMRYTYEIKNYPGNIKGVQANMLIYKENVLGGEVESPEESGFMHGFAMPEQTRANNLLSGVKQPVPQKCTCCELCSGKENCSCCELCTCGKVKDAA